MMLMSEQNLMDCVRGPKYRSRGCNGGFPDEAFDYIKNNGIESESDYPYESKMEQCQFEKAKSVVKITGHHVDTSGNEELLKNSVATIGPIAGF